MKKVLLVSKNKRVIENITMVFNASIHSEFCLLSLSRYENIGEDIINPKYRVHVDFERFEDVFNKFLKEQDLRGKEKFFKTARHIYRGTLLPKCDHIHWFIPRIGYYQSMYLQLLKEYLLQKLQEGDYRVAQRIAVEGLADEPYDTDLIMYQIICLYQLGNRSLARNYYNRFETELTGEQRELIEKYKK